ncbi:MAG: hypothetical protein U1E66_01380 [Rhodospirillales bacterium]
MEIGLIGCAPLSAQESHQPHMNQGTYVTPHPLSENDVSAAFRADKAKDYAVALPIFERIADASTPPADLSPDLAEKFLKNVAWAELHIGLYYENGLGVPQDYHNAALWYQHASQVPVPRSLDVANAKVKLGLFNYYGLGIPRNIDNARTLVADGEYSLVGTTNYAYLIDHGLMPTSADEGLHLGNHLNEMVASDRKLHNYTPVPVTNDAHESYTALLEQVVSEDAAGWGFNKYDVGSMHGTRVLSLYRNKGDGSVKVSGMYTYNGGAKGSVVAKVIDGKVICLEYADTNDCRPPNDPEEVRREKAKLAAEITTHQAAEQAAWNRMTRGQKADHCKVRCQSEASACQSENYDMDVWFPDSSWIQSSKSNCGDVAVNCMQNCMAGN